MERATDLDAVLIRYDWDVEGAMKKRDALPVLGRILRGYRPFLSIEITKECPLRCPGCYAYAPEHVGNGITLRQLSDFRGEELVTRVLDLVRRLHPAHVSIVGGEPLVRYRELDAILPRLEKLVVEIQLVTSAVRPIPQSWAGLANLHFVVSVDGLQPEHDKRRAPATYSRILENISGHRVIIHCTITKQLLGRPGYFSEFCRYWSALPQVRRVWFSLYTPQEGENSEERLTPEDREQVIRELNGIRRSYPKLQLPESILQAYARPPRSPQECIFSQITTSISADLESRISPCQFGGRPVCSECGCIASAGMTAIGNIRLAGLIPASKIFALSSKVGRYLGPKDTAGPEPGSAASPAPPRVTAPAV